ncbi:MAG: precorrin-3B C(17)-methyltransferase [Deltaproteobacteria bacterium]|nr:precorrin-3B C(17)-methyltransferase [Deltaproteobacteria bacterium]
MIGLGSKGPGGITLDARKALGDATVVIGYKLYLEQAGPFLRPDARRESSGMTRETKRAEDAIEMALKGEKVAVVSGGDPGIYAMSGVVFEVAAAKKIPLGEGKGELSIKVIPGTPALTAASSILGAPITHDFCAISLSDRLTDWELIKKRLSLASRGDFVIVVYNPRSRGRDWQLGEAMAILLEKLDPDTPVGLASRCGRKGEKGRIVTLGTLKIEEVDMQTLVIIGNSTTFVWSGHMITPRGYVKKYGSGERVPDEGEGFENEDGEES